MVGGTAQPFHPIGDSNTDAFQSLCLHTFSGQHPDATGIARDSLSLTGPSLLSKATRHLVAHPFRSMGSIGVLRPISAFVPIKHFTSPRALISSTVAGTQRFASSKGTLNQSASKYFSRLQASSMSQVQQSNSAANPTILPSLSLIRYKWSLCS